MREFLLNQVSFDWDHHSFQNDQCIDGIVLVSFCFTNLVSDQIESEEKSWMLSRQPNESGLIGSAILADSQNVGLGPAGWL